MLSTVAMLFVSMMCWRDPQLYLKLASDSVAVFQDQEYWKLFSALLVHADLRHFVSNGVLFLVFGYLLYGYFGVWVFPIGAVALGGIVNGFSLWTYLPRDVRLVGASGMVYLMASFWLAMYLFLERRHPMGRRLLRALGVGLIVLMPGAFDQSISYRTHFIGALAGMLSALIFFHCYRSLFRSAEVSDNEEDSPGSGETGFWIRGGADEV